MRPRIIIGDNDAAEVINDNPGRPAPPFAVHEPATYQVLLTYRLPIFEANTKDVVALRHGALA